MPNFQVFVAWTPQPSPQGSVYGVLKIGVALPMLYADNTSLPIFQRWSSISTPSGIEK